MSANALLPSSKANELSPKVKRKVSSNQARVFFMDEPNYCFIIRLVDIFKITSFLHLDLCNGVVDNEEGKKSPLFG